MAQDVNSDTLRMMSARLRDLAELSLYGKDSRQDIKRQLHDIAETLYNITTAMAPLRLGEIREQDLDGTGIRLIGGRTIYRECGYMWRSRSRNTMYVAPKRYAEYASSEDWAKARRFLPDDTPVELVPLPTDNT